jgi:uncharacterized membrane protein
MRENELELQMIDRRVTLAAVVALAMQSDLLYMAGLVMFAVLPAVGSGGWMRAGLLGGCLGLVAYGTYDLTNLATLKNWSRAMTVVDILWGGAVSAATAAGACFLVML